MKIDELIEKYDKRLKWFELVISQGNCVDWNFDSIKTTIRNYTEILQDLEQLKREME